MLITRAPVRISFAGGGTDLPAYYERYGGAVLSTSIDKYFYVMMNVTRNEELQITSSDYRTFYRHNREESLECDGALGLPRAILSYFGISRGVHMFLASEVPPGTGLGSSSSVAVAVIKAVSTACGLNLSRKEIAELACTIEIEKMKMPIGKQDQYAAAFGGLNYFTFASEGIEVEPIRVQQEILEGFRDRLLLFYTGAARDSGSILSEQTKNSSGNDATVISALHAVKTMAADARRMLERGQLLEIGALLHESWQHKRRFASGVTKPYIDEAYELARAKGAIGGKLTGAGGGGFMMLYCEPRRQPAVTEALERLGLKRMDFNFEKGGARVLMNASLRLFRGIAQTA